LTIIISASSSKACFIDFKDFLASGAFWGFASFEHFMVQAVGNFYSPHHLTLLAFLSHSLFDGEDVKQVKVSEEGG